MRVGTNPRFYNLSPWGLVPSKFLGAWGRTPVLSQNLILKHVQHTMSRSEVKMPEDDTS